MLQSFERFYQLIVIVVVLWMGVATFAFTSEHGLNSLVREKTGDWFLGYPFNILDGRGYVDCEPDRRDPYSVECATRLDRYAYRLPGYPIYLLGHVIIFGRSQIVSVVRISQILLACFIVWFSMHIAVRLSGKKAGILTASAIALWVPIFGYYTSLLMAETWFTFLLLCFAYAFIFASGRFFWIGVLWGIILLTRGNYLLATPLLFLFVSRQRWHFAAGVAVPLGLWIVRNMIVLGAIVPFSTGSGIVLLGTNNAGTDGTYWINMERVPAWFAIVDLPELEQDRSAQQIALDYFFRQPNIPFILVMRAVTAFYNPNRDGGLLDQLALVAYIMLLAIAIYRVVKRKRVVSVLPLELRKALILAFVLIIGLVGNAIVFYGSSRFRLPLDPLLFVIIAALICNTLSRHSKRMSNARGGMPKPSKPSSIVETSSFNR